MTLSGSPPAPLTVTTDAVGNYSFTGLSLGGFYTVTPTMVGTAPGSPRINIVDVLAVVLPCNALPPPSGCRLIAADVNMDNLITCGSGLTPPSDSELIKNFYQVTPPYAMTGQYKFTPSAQSYAPFNLCQNGQDFDALIWGDVQAQYVYRPQGPSQTSAAVTLPNVAVGASVTNFIAQVTTTAMDTGDNLVGFQGDFTFDESVVTFQSSPVQKAGITSGNWNVSGNVLPGSGPIRTLRIAAYSNDLTPLSGSGTLLELSMTRVSSSSGASTALTWSASPANFFFVDTDLNTSEPANTPPGSITITGTGTPTPTPASVSISGKISYCSNPTLPGVANVTLTLTGSGSGSTLSDGSGNYQLASLTAGGSYTVTPTKAALLPGSTGITTVDVIATQRHYLNVTPIPVGCRLTAADVTGDNNVTTVDVIAIQRFFLGLSTGTANVGKYKFSPVSRSYPSVVNDQTAQHYDTLIFGDVASPFGE